MQAPNCPEKDSTVIALQAIKHIRRQAPWMLLLLAGAALAEPRPITELPLESAGDGQWLLPAGEYRGQFIIDQPMHLRCAAGAMLDGQGQGNLVTLGAPGVTFEGCTLRNWGRDLTAMDAAIFIQPKATGAVVRDNHLQGPGFGIWLDNVSSAQVLGNHIQGDPSIRTQDRGNGVHVYLSKDALIGGNYVQHTRDGIYIDASTYCAIEDNVFEEVRYAVHFMWTNNTRVVGNLTRRTRTGYALMQSRSLTVTGNRSEHDQNYGILMNYITYSTIRDNFVSDVQRGDTEGDSMISGGEGKALFIYNSLFNTIEHNHLARSGLGIHLTAGSEDNRISGNASSATSNRSSTSPPATRNGRWTVAVTTGATTWAGTATTMASATWPTSPTTTSTACSGCTRRYAC
ncbi:nitrous oxidase accessory protein [Pseudomonas sp. BAY1663]|nr:nitrous oxidase accessory protein [Pseudomonas sp. BAY1663]